MSTPPRIKSVAASNFRGATTKSDIKLDSSKPFVLIFGENGSGKSTIVDAIDIVANQRASLTDVSGANLKAHLPSLGSSSEELSASISIGDATWAATFSGAKIAISPDVPVPAVQVLRRNKILSLILAMPNDRFKQLKHFIDVDNVQKSEDKLNKACLELEKTVESIRQELKGCEQTLKTDFENNRTDDEANLTWEEWAKKRSSIEAKSVKENLQKLVEALKGDTICQELLARRNDKQSELNEARSNRDEALKRLQENAVSNTEDPSKLVAVLESAKSYFSDLESLEACPVCKKPNDLESITGEVLKSLNEHSILVELTGSVNTAQTTVRDLENTITGLYEELSSKCKVLLGTLQELAEVTQFDTSFGDELYPELSKTGDDEKAELTRQLIEEIPRFLDQANGVVKILEQERSKLEQFSLIKEAYERLIGLRSENQTKRDVWQLLKRMLESVRTQRKSFIQETLDAVADECDRLYEAIHPGEAIGQVRFALKEEGQGSMNLEGSFQGHDSIPPQAYFSDSHLDTLGFCFFLALAKHSNDGDVIVVLDDVFTTVDLNHLECVFNLLLAEASVFHQIIMTSHQRKWLNLIKDQRVPGKDVQLLTLQEWDISSGVHAHPVDSAIERVRGLMNQLPFERNLVASSAGRLIEGVLEEMTKYLELSIRRNPLDKYTAYPLLTAVKRKVNRIGVHKVKSIEGSKEQELDELCAPALAEIVDELLSLLNDARNTVGAHYNWDEVNVSDAEVRKFGENAIALGERFVCDDCQGMATKEKDGYLWCSCRRLRVTKPN